MMEITGLDMKEAEAFLLNLVAEIRAGSEVHIDLSEEIRDAVRTHHDIVYNLPTGNMTLVVKWKRGKVPRAIIDEKRFRETELEIEEEMGYNGLADSKYGEFALRVAERYIAEMEK